MREAENIEDKKVSDIDRERALLAPERIANIVKYILEHFDQKTKRNVYYKLKDRRLAGFNSIFLFLPFRPLKPLKSIMLSLKNNWQTCPAISNSR